MRGDTLIQCGAISIVIIIQIVIIALKSDITYKASEACSRFGPISSYPIIGSSCFLLGIIFRVNGIRIAPWLQSFGLSILVAPFVSLIIDSCHLTMITYVTIEFFMNILWQTVQSKSDIMIVGFASILKLYIYISYTVIDVFSDGHRGVVLYLVFDGFFMIVRSLFVGVRITETGQEDAAKFLQNLAMAQLALQALVAQHIANSPDQ